MFRDGGILNRRGVVMSLSSVHAWSLVAAVGHVNDCHHCCSCVELPLMLAPPFDDASLSQPSCEVLFDTPSWCDGSSNHHTTPPTVDDVHDEAVVLVGRLSVGVKVLILVDTDV